MTPALLGQARADLARARARLVGGSIGEADWSAVEGAANRLRELEDAIAGGRDLRVFAGRLVPSRPARRTDVVLPAIAEATLARDVVRARERAEAYAGRLAGLYGYNLVTANCVSEIFRGVDAALASPGGEARGESTRRLGGYVAPVWPANFIPFVAARAVRRAYDVAETSDVPSYRQARLADMARHERPLAVALRESNTLTSTVYRPNADDSFFLFFTDGAVAPRPVLGAVNLLVGIGASTLGLVTLPLDGGATLGAGLRGALFSLPELAFVNLRKGSFTYVPPPGTEP